MACVKINPPDLFADPRPRLIVTDDSSEFWALWDRQETGELRLLSMERGSHNAQWVCWVDYLGGGK